MSPLEQYNSIVDYWRKNPLKRGGEVHHIIPRSCGGCDKKWNKVRMPTLEHINCHRLLCDIYPSGSQHESMAIAYDLMLTSRDGVKVSPEEAARARDEARKAKRGKPSPRKGKPGKSRKRTEEEKRAISEALKGRKCPWLVGKPNLGRKGKAPWNKGKTYKTGKPAWNKGLPGHPSWNKGMKMPPRSEEWRRKISEAAKARWERYRAAKESNS